ncbi:MAG TPA: iron-containing redox enzyme family protein [Candidatus Binatia bacterium]|jgi:pyrroloquinoline-quinone synthase
MSSSFRDQLITVRDNKHSKNHPFFDKWARGELSKEQTALYCIQHYHFVGEYLNWMAYEASQVPQRDVKTYLFENLGDEENPEDRHLDMLTDYVVASGLKRESVERSAVLPGTEGLQNWGWRMVYQKPWQAALAGMFIGLESQFLDICKKLVPALHKHYGYKPAAREIRFFEEHIGADEIHGAKGFAIVEKYCTTPELQHLALKTVEEATIRRWRYMNGVYWFALHGKEDDTPPA